MDDRTAAELITRGIAESLSQQEEAALEQHLAQCSTSKDFAQWSARIQKVIEDFRETDASAVEGPGLDPVTRKRLEMRLLEALNALTWNEPTTDRGRQPDQRSRDPGTEVPHRRKVAEDPLDYDSDSLDSDSLMGDKD
jgi:hypothetical protein